LVVRGCEAGFVRPVPTKYVPAMRICSLLPSATEIVADLGLIDSLVGVSEECAWPPEVRDKPRVTAAKVDSKNLSCS
jgi:iron complex transport system substrate-binding protein